MTPKAPPMLTLWIDRNFRGLGFDKSCEVNGYSVGAAMLAQAWRPGWFGRLFKRLAKEIAVARSLRKIMESGGFTGATFNPSAVRSLTCGRHSMHQSLRFSASMVLFCLAGAAFTQEKKADDADDKAAIIAAVAKAKISLKDAIAAAQKKLPTGKPIEAEISLEGDKTIYTIELHFDDKQMVVDVDVVTGVAGDPYFENEADAEKDDDDAEVAALKSPTSLLKALDIGQGNTPTGKAFYIGVASEEGRTAYEVDFVAGDKIVTIEVNAANGAILSVEEE